MPPSDRTVKVSLKGDLSDFNRAMLGGVASAKAFSKELDSSTDRTTTLTQSALALGPALVPISTIAVPAIAGLTNQLAFAATGAGVAALAFSGIGEALKATNDYAIEPTEANLQKMQQSLSELGPAGADFVAFLQELRPQLQGLQDMAQAGLFPGVEEGITEAMELLPQFERIVFTVADTMGSLIAEAGDNLNDPRWVEFFTFIEREAKPTLEAMGRTLGNFAEGFANLWMAFDPLSDDFSASFLQLSRDFAAWTDGLSETEGFQEFVEYIQTNGPRAWEALGAIGNALLQIVEAAAPVGAAALPIIEALADAISLVADSDLGPIIIGVISLTSALSRMKALGIAANSSALGGLFGGSAMGGGLSNIKAVTAASNELRVAQSKLADNPGMQGLTTYRENLKGVATAEKNLAAATKARNTQFRAAATGVGAMAFVMSDLDDKLGLTNAAMGAMLGSLLGPWGAALGGGIGLVRDFATANGDAAEKIQSLADQVAAAGTKNLDAQRDAAAKASALAEIGGGDPKLFEQADKVWAAYQKNVYAAQDLKFAQAGLTAAMEGASDATRNEVAATLDLIAARNEAANQALAARDAERGLEAAIDNATDAVKENGKTHDIHTPKGRANAAALDAIAAAWNNLSGEAQRAPGAQAEARDAFIKSAIAMGYEADEAKRLAKSLFEIPPIVPVDVRARGLVKTKNDIDAIRDSLARLPKTTDLVIRTFRETYGQASGGSREDGVPRAYGGEILGPGGPRDDLIPVMASNKEIMVNAYDAQEHRALLLGINAGRFRGRTPEFRAYGGEIGGRVQRMTGGGYSSPSTAGAVMSVSLKGAKVEFGKDGLGEFVDGRIDIVSSGNDNYRASRSRAGTP